jgi:hypothetical protein
VKLPYAVMCMFGWAITDQRLVELDAKPPQGWEYDIEFSVWFAPGSKRV